MCSSNCEHPERRPQDGVCSKQLQMECHGKVVCENPQLRPKDGECSEELKQRCHGKGN